MTPAPRLDAWLERPDARVAVIGASGWIGMALADRLLAAAPSPDRLRLLGSGHRAIEVAGRRLEVEPLDGARLEAGDWLVLHAAIIGADRVEGGDLDETRRRNDALMDQALALAAQAEARRLVLFSSGAAGRPDFGGPAKRAYARMKLEHEQAAAAWAAEHGCALLTPRVFNLGGPYINHLDAYALGDFLRAARDGSIAIGAAQPVFRSYVHVLEMGATVLDMALKPEPIAEPFDVAGTEVVELAGLARAVGEALGMADIPVTRPPASDAEADWYVGAGRTYQTALFETGGTPVPLARIVADTLAWLRATGVL